MINQPETVPVRKEHVRVNNFNLLRLLAAFQVLWVHALNHFGYEGYLVSALKLTPGVPMFFFISGLLISAAYERSRPQGLPVFFRNRFLRIFPALWLSTFAAILSVIAVGYFATRVVSVPHFLLWLTGQASIFQFYNPPFMRGYGVGVMNGALWTISVELQFYLLVPLLFLLFRRHIAGLAVFFMVSLALNLYLRFALDWSNVAMKLVAVSFLPWVYMFMTGFLAHTYREQVDRVLHRVPFAILAALFVASMLLVGSYAVNASNAINPVSFFLLSALVLKASASRMNIPTVINDFIRRNDFSYGIYLYHMPVINLLLYSGWLGGRFSLFATVVLSLLAALLSWYVVEKPALSIKIKNDGK
jgi:peptidoglycan/LPS O-acetylase OafA/YrhL